MVEFDSRLNAGWWALRIGLGVGPIITGIDKYFNKLTDWGMYLSPMATKVVPISPATFMHIVGAVEIVAGLIVLSRWTKIGAYIVMLWLLGIAVNLLTTGMFYDLAMRDVEIAIGAFVLSQLTAVREQAEGSKQIRLAVENINKITSQVAFSTKEQAAGGRQVRTAVENMNKIAAQVGIATKEQADGSRQIIQSVEQEPRPKP
jgi:hypothetical protein